MNSFTKCGVVEPDPDLTLSDLLLTPQLNMLPCVSFQPKYPSTYHSLRLVLPVGREAVDVVDHISVISGRPLWLERLIK